VAEAEEIEKVKSLAYENRAMDLSFKEKALGAISRLRSEHKEVLLVHHDDADGISSSALIKVALEREGFKVKTLCLERLYPQVLRDLHKDRRAILYVDIGSPHANLISEYNGGRNLTVILDHHNPSPTEDPSIFDLNLEYSGLKGETDFSSSTCCYLFAKELDEKNFDLSYLALVGSLEIPGKPSSLTLQVQNEALEKNMIRKRGGSFVSTKLGLGISQIFSSLQILGSVGYYKGGPEVGIELCLYGQTSEAKKTVKALEVERKKANKRLIADLYKERLRESEHVQYFDSGEAFKGMGTKVIGTFCSFLSYQARLINSSKYILGFMDVPQQVPGWGSLEERFVKASMRVPRDMQSSIMQHLMPSAVDLLQRSTREIGGVADGHDFAASCTFPIEYKAELVGRIEKAIQELRWQKG